MLFSSLSPQEFISNLLKSCRRTNYLRDDGKAIGRFDYFLGFLFGRDYKSHFKKICERLISDPQLVKEFESLDYDEKLEIFSRLNRIKKRINNKQIRRECEDKLQQLEALVFEDRKNEGGVKRINDIFLQCLDSSTKDDPVELDRHLRKFYTLIEHYESEYKVISQVSDMWSQLWTSKARELNEEREQKPLFSFFSDLFKSWYSFLGLDQLFNLNIGSSERILNRTHDRVLSKLMRVQNEIFRKNRLVLLDAKSYASLFRYYFLSNIWNEKAHSKEVKEQFDAFTKIIHEHRNNDEFVYGCMIEIEHLLKDLHRKGEQGYVFLPGSARSGMSIIQGFFPLVEENFNVIDRLDKERDFKGESRLGLRLKLLLSNFPCPRPRAAFPKIFLEKTEQLGILTAHFQLEEDQRVRRLCRFLERHGIDDHGRKRLAKLLSIQSRLSPENLLMLREKILTLASQEESYQPLKPWDDKDLIISLLKKVPHHTFKNTEIEELRQLSKTKLFFIHQIGMPEEHILIPRWYDAVKEHDFKSIRTNINGIFKQRKRKSRTKEAEYIMDISQRIAQIKIERTMEIHYKKHKFNPFFNGPTEKKINEGVLFFLEESGIFQSLTARQVEYMQKQVQSILADPNLSDQWNDYDPLYSEYQAELETRLHRLALNTSWFLSKSETENQIAIDKILQKCAIPFYKELMPLSVSYQDKNCRVRLSLQNEEEYQNHAQKVAAKQAIARDSYGCMHCVRSALWTQVLRRFYMNLGRQNVESDILLAVAGAFLNIAREANPMDFWEEESSEKLEIILRRGGISKETTQIYVDALREKKERHCEYTSDIARILYDVECIEKVRFSDKPTALKQSLCSYALAKSKKDQSDLQGLIEEMIEFIDITEQYEVRYIFEFESSEYYADLIKLLFAVGNDRKKFGTFHVLMDLIESDVFLIIQNPLSETINKVLKTLDENTVERVAY